MVTLTQYCYTLSTWSLAAEAAIADVRSQFGRDLTYRWRLAALNYNGGKGAFAEGELDAPYARLRSITGQNVSIGWWRDGYDWLVPDRVVEGARALGSTSTDVRLALARAGLHNGEDITNLEVALSIASRVSGLERGILRDAATSPLTLTRLYQMSVEFRDLAVPWLPAFKLTNDINDTVVFSGVWRTEPIRASIEALLADDEEYRRLGYLPPGR